MNVENYLSVTPNVFLSLFISGKMKGLAFIKDPDGYWIEILNPNNMKK